jgi:rhamnogalacturonyl hydrolase YesR
MLNKIVISVVSFVILSFSQRVFAQDDFDKVFNVADHIIDNTSFKIVNKKTKDVYSSTKGLGVLSKIKIECAYNDWKYENGVMAIGMAYLSEVTGNKKYRDYARHLYSFIFENLDYFKKLYDSGVKHPSFFKYFRLSMLDDCGAMGAGLYEVYKFDAEKEYREYMIKAADYILTGQLRLDDGTLSRDWPRKNTIWADDLYMSVPFLARMAKLTGENKYFDDAIKQVKNFNLHLFNESNGLYYHCWYSDNEQNGVAHWGRCNGWIVMAEVELLKLLPDNNSDKEELIKILENHLIGISRFQDASGMWHQLINKPDSYPESSSTAMFVYAIASAVNNGWIDESYATVAKDGWEALLEKVTDKGELEGTCKGTGIKDNIKYYYDRPAPLNDIHGLGAFLLAGAEMMKLND